MKVLHVVPRIAAQSSGPSYSVVRLCQAQQEAGAEVQLHVLEPLPDRELGFPVYSYPTGNFPGAWRLGWSPAMRQGLIEAAKGLDIVHNHSLWMMPNVYCYEAARAAGARLVMSPRGTLSDWALRRSRLRKKLVWWGGQRRALFGADGLHATSEMEREDFRRRGLSQAVIRLPNGVDVPRMQPSELKKARNGRSTVLFLSRIHPTKGVDRLLRAWAMLEPRYDDWDLVVAGPLRDGYAHRMQALARELNLTRVRFVGEVDGQEKSEYLASSSLFVLPTHSESFGVAVAEALAHGTPVIVTRAAPWGGLETHNCGWWIENDETLLVETLDHAMALPAGQREAMGMRGRVWMLTDFSWQALGRESLQWYARILNLEELWHCPSL